MDSVLVAIEAKRKSLSVSQESLATVAGLTQRQYRRYLTGCAQPRRSTILRLQNTLCLLERMGERALNPHTITYLVAIVCAARGEQVVPLDVLAHDPARRGSVAWVTGGPNQWSISSGKQPHRYAQSTIDPVIADRSEGEVSRNGKHIC